MIYNSRTLLLFFHGQIQFMQRQGKETIPLFSSQPLQSAHKHPDI